MSVAHLGLLYVSNDMVCRAQPADNLLCSWDLDSCATGSYA